jgi:hypothetical protein
MNPAAANSLRARLEIALWRNGYAWVLATALIAAGVAAYLAALGPSQQTLASLQAELGQTRQRAAAASANGSDVPAPQSEPRRLLALHAVLRQSAESSEVVRKMAALAEAEQIRLAQSDYQRQLHSGIQVSQVLITQPVRATYPQLRRYIESVLRTVPNISLDQIAARRENVGQTQVEARLKWSLWIQPAAAAPAATRQEPKP